MSVKKWNEDQKSVVITATNRLDAKTRPFVVVDAEGKTITLSPSDAFDVSHELRLWFNAWDRHHRRL